MRRTLRLLADLALTLGALVGVVCLLAGIGSVAFGVHPLIFRSGSMAPTIPAGAVAFARDVPASQIRVGDVVTVPWHSSRVTHRVVEVFHRHGSATLKLRGDANSLPDQDLYQVSSAPRVWFSVPVAGTVVAWLSRVPGVFVLAAYAALLLSIILRRSVPGGAARGRGSPADDPSGEAVDGSDRPVDGDVETTACALPAARSGEPVTRPGRRRAAAVLGVVVCVLMLGTVTVPPTWGAWVDQSTVSGTTASTYTLPKPPLTSCAVSGNTVTGQTATISWTGVTTSFVFGYSATVQETGTVLTVTKSGTTFQTTFNSGLLGTVLNQTYHVLIRTTLGTNWASSQATTQPVTVGLLGLSLTCGTSS